MYASDPAHFPQQNQNNAETTYSLTRLLHLVVWLCFVISSLVLYNPAPVDGLMIGLVFLLPLAGMTRFSREMYFYLAMMMMITAGAFIGIFFAFTFGKALTHAIITCYLSLFTFVLAGYIAKDPKYTFPLIMNGWTIAAWIAVATGIMGYFDVAGTGEIFTKFERAKGMFKDPNVYGTYLIPPALYAIYKITHFPLSKALMPTITLGVMAVGILLSFSRGAWLNLAICGVFFVYFSYITSKTNFYRIKIILLGFVSLFAMVALLFALLQNDKISTLLTQRAKVTQSYDTKDGGRFAGHDKARIIIPSNPLGIGPNQFGSNYHNEDIHNVYYNLFLNSGWMGGFAYLIMVLGTLAKGFRHLFRHNETKAFFLVAYTCFVGNAIEGIIIDSDHWRHFFVLLSMVWGMMAYEKRQKKLQK